MTTTSKSAIEKIDEFTAFLPRIRSYSSDEFDKRFHRSLRDINAAAAHCPAERSHLVRYCLERSSAELDQSIVHWHGRRKPHGYAGDYQIIDYIYTRKADSPGDGRLWDEFFHRQHAPRAVRNRMSYFTSLFGPLFARETPISVLNVASGPCRDMLQVAQTWSAQAGQASFHCVDADPHAIGYAQRLLAPSRFRHIAFEKANALKCRPEGSFDLVWSSGLFDYLDDRLAVFLLKRMWKWTKDNGRVVVGNFHVNHASRDYIEWCGDWFLIHRSEDDFRRLCRAAGIPNVNVSFESEPLGACFFLSVHKV